MADQPLVPRDGPSGLTHSQAEAVIKGWVKEATREENARHRAQAGPPQPAVVVVQHQAAPPPVVRTPGDKFAKCEVCSEMVHWAANPKLCARPYRPCKNDCPSKNPKAVHLSCLRTFVQRCSQKAVFSSRDEEEDDEGPLGFECDVCHGKVEISLAKSNVKLFEALCCNIYTLLIAILLCLFLSTGIIWQYWQFRSIVYGYEPIDPINNPALIYLNKTTHNETFRRPNWSEFRSYNHCVLTNYGERVINKHLRRLLAAEDDYVPLGKLSVEETFTAFYALVMDGGDDDLSKYFYLCGGRGWFGGIVNYVEVCVYATAYAWYGVGALVCAYLLFRFCDNCCCNGGMMYQIRKNRSRPVVIVDGEPIRLSGRVSGVANQKRKLSMRKMN